MIIIITIITIIKIWWQGDAREERLRPPPEDQRVHGRQDLCPGVGGHRNYASAVGANYYTPEITNVTVYWKMQLTCHWTMPVQIHWTSDNPLEISLNIEIVLESATEHPLEHATENPR